MESSNKRPVYVVGEQLAVRCRLNTSSPECIEASIAEYLLYPSVAMLIGAGLLIGGLYMRRRADDSEMVSQNI
ncbi:MAG: hypothetical protein LC113_03320 [Acidobacteria bacterium]|nr:hypothetical protein [Acidobacteriota bacterium]